MKKELEKQVKKKVKTKTRKIEKRISNSILQGNINVLTILILAFLLLIFIIYAKPEILEKFGLVKKQNIELQANYHMNKEYIAEVVNVIDGDTIEVKLKKEKYSTQDNSEYINLDEKLTHTKYKIRLLGIDTPESVHRDKSKNSKLGEIASEYTRYRLEGREVVLEFDISPVDKYGRLLAYLWLDGEMFNKELIEKGYARLMTIPPNIKYEKELKETYDKLDDTHKRELESVFK